MADTIERNNEPISLHIVCERQGPEWFYCYGILSNGFCFGTHICSHPNFAPGDLYFGRPERIYAIESLFGVKFAQGDYTLDIVKSSADIPEWWHAHGELQAGLKAKYEEYKALVTDTTAHASIIVQEESNNG